MLERAAILADGGLIADEHLSFRRRAETAPRPASPAAYVRLRRHGLDA